MKFEMIPNVTSQAVEALQPLLLLVAVPLAVSLIFGIRKEPIVLAALVLGSVVALVR